jgi:hypothetical protein
VSEPNDVFATFLTKISTANNAAALVKTPARDVAETIREGGRRGSSILQQAQQNVAVSPARVAAEFDARVAQPIQASVSKALDKLQLAEYTDAIRDWASTPAAIAVLALVFEFNGLRSTIMPMKHFYDVPLTRGKVQSVTVPDVFVILTPEFWTPFSFWTGTSIVLPLIAAYFVNFTLKSQTTHNYGTRRATAQASTGLQFDSFVYFVAKGLISYLIYARHRPDLDHKGLYLGPYGHATASEINSSIWGGYSLIILTSIIGASLSMYEAVLRK